MLLKILIITIVIAFGENNNVQAKEVNSLNQQNRYNCNETESWETLQHSNKAINRVCIRKDYQNNEPPMKRSLTPLLVLDHETKLSDINEKGKALELDIKMTLICEDARIKSEFDDYMDFHRLPPILKHGTSLIWVPSTQIGNLKFLQFLDDPIKFSWVLLFPSNPEMVMFSLNTTLIQAFIEWHVTVSCDFDFSNYPFDDQSCGFRMMLYDSKITYYEMPFGAKLQLSKNATQTHGFDVTKIMVPTTQETMPGTVLEYGKFGYDLKIKRIIRPFIYQYFLPCGSIVVAACLSFIVPISATPGRIALVVTQFLTLTNLFINQKVRMVK